MPFHAPLLSLLAVTLLRTVAPSGSPEPGAEVHGWIPAPSQPAQRVQRELGCMGTALRVIVEAHSRSAALAASESGVLAVEAVERRLSTWTQESEVAALNRAGIDERFALSEVLVRDLQRASDVWLCSEHSFDPAIGELIDLWGIRSGGRATIPSRAQVHAAIVPNGFAALELGRDASGPFAVRRHASVRIEEGGFGKGVGLDAGLAAIRAAGATAAVLDLGGQVAVWTALPSAHADDTTPAGPLSFEIADPADRARSVVTVDLLTGSFATSGNSERSVQVGNEPRGHLLDPRSGNPADDFGSVTVFAQDATTADMLSTALFVLGPERALSYAASVTGIEVLVLDTRSERLRARATNGLSNRLHPNPGSDLVIEWFPAADDAASASSPSSEER